MTQSLKVIVVDDEKEIGQMLKYVFDEEISNQSVKYNYFENPLDSVEEIFANEHFYKTSVVIDYKMPGMNGVELLTLIKNMNPDIDVYMVSAFMEEKDRNHCLSLGARSCFSKPINMYEIKKVLMAS